MGTDALQPIKVRPLLDAKPWGGRRLETCGVALPAGTTIGEALLTAPEALVAGGPLEGSSLAELARLDPEHWVGSRGLAATGGRPLFPLLVKLIDANADLSIQVHPDDAAAAAADLGTGKTEAWHILDSRPGSGLYLGLAPDANEDNFRYACLRADGSAARYLRWIPAVPGQTLLVPAGTLHAIGAGLLVYEIQQPSNVTFRLDDWGRRDDRGQPRELHHEAGFVALDPESRPEPLAPVTLSPAEPRRELLVATRYFALERLALSQGAAVSLPPCDSPQAFTCISGHAELTTAFGQTAVRAGETAIVPAGVPSDVAASPTSALLRGWVPDLKGDVIGPALAAGASLSAIRQLGMNADLD